MLRLCVALESVSLIIFQLCVIVAAFTSTKNSNSDGSRIGMLNKEVLYVNHSMSSVAINPTRGKRFVMEEAITKSIEVVTELLVELIVNNVEQSFDNAEREKEHAEILAHFQRIESELEGQKEELQSINREIKRLGLSVGYSKHEEKIKNSFLALHQYLEHPDERNRDTFTQEASQLSQSLTAIVDGLLGQNAFNLDIMAVLQDVIGVKAA
jgi:hypothetical protein